MRACKRVPHYYLGKKKYEDARHKFNYDHFSLPTTVKLPSPARCPSKNLWTAGGSMHQVRELRFYLFFQVFIVLPCPWIADDSIIMDGLLVNKNILRNSNYKN